MIELGVSLGLIAAGVIVLLTGYALSGSRFPKCWRCKTPLVNGFEATEAGGPVCQTCCRKHGIRPWYWKDVLGAWPGKSP